MDLLGFGPATPVLQLKLRCQVCGETCETLSGGMGEGYNAKAAAKTIERFEKEHKNCWERHPTLQKYKVYKIGQLYHAYSPCEYQELPGNALFLTRKDVLKHKFKCACLLKQDWVKEAMSRGR